MISSEPPDCTCTESLIRALRKWYATLHIKDVLARNPGVGDIQLMGEREYAMRIWMDPDKAATSID